MNLEVNMDLNADVSKDVVDKALEAIEVAVKSGKIKKGTNEVTMHLPALCEEKGIPLVPVPTREVLGSSAGLNIPTSAIAIIQEGESKVLIKEITSKLKK